jgi:hypothetical protein
MMIFVTNHKVRPVSAPRKQKKTVVGTDFDEEHAYEMNEIERIHSDLKNHFRLLKIPFTTHIKINQFLYPPIFGHTNQHTIKYVSPYHQTADLETHHFDTITYYHDQPYCRLSCSNVQAIFNLTNHPAIAPVKNNNIFQELTKSPVLDSFSKETDETISSSAKTSLLSAAKIQVPVVLGEYDMGVCIDETTQINKGIVGIKEVSKEVVLTHCHSAVEIKRILKDVEIEQCKLVPVGPFVPINDSGFFTSDNAKLFISGFIRKNIEYAAKGCNGAIRTTTARVPFSGFADLSGNLLNPPIFGFGDQRRAQFIDPKTGESPRFDKFFFQNSVILNEQPFCELISAEFFELDFSPNKLDVCKSFDTLREKIVLDLTLKVLQTQQVPLNDTYSARHED